MAYPGSVPPGPQLNMDLSAIIPYQTTLRNGVPVVLQQLIVPSTVDRNHRNRLVVVDGTRCIASRATVRSMRALLNLEIEGGQTYPFEAEMSDEVFVNYYCGYDVFILKAEDAVQSTNVAGVPQLEDPTLVGCFYIKPNFPGRSSHICNAGFLVAPAYRNSGAGYIMGERFRHLAKKLGYYGSMYNLVYRTNEASNKLWEKLGFVNIGVIPNAGRLRLQPQKERAGDRSPTAKKEEGYVDALMWYFDLTIPVIPHLRAPWEPPLAGVVRQRRVVSKL
jgi:GNAT superfamily N-acetyltransferase